MDHDHRRPSLLRFRSGQIGPDRTGFAGVLDLFRVEARIVRRNDLRLGPKVRQQGVCSSRTADEAGECPQKLTATWRPIWTPIR